MTIALLASAVPAVANAGYIDKFRVVDRGSRIYFYVDFCGNAGRVAIQTKISKGWNTYSDDFGSRYQGSGCYTYTASIRDIYAEGTWKARAYAYQGGRRYTSRSFYFSVY